MTNTNGDHGAQLHAFLQTHWDATGFTRRGWCDANGISNATVFRWTTGAQPDIRLMKQVAAALDRSLVEIMYLAGYITKAELAGRAVATPAPPSLADAIELDPKLTDQQREAFRAVYTVAGLDKPRKHRRTRVSH